MASSGRRDGLNRVQTSADTGPAWSLAWLQAPGLTSASQRRGETLMRKWKFRPYVFCLACVFLALFPRRQSVGVSPDRRVASSPAIAALIGALGGIGRRGDEGCGGMLASPTISALAFFTRCRLRMNRPSRKLGATSSTLGGVGKRRFAALASSDGSEVVVLLLHEGDGCCPRFFLFFFSVCFSCGVKGTFRLTRLLWSLRFPR